VGKPWETGSRVPDAADEEIGNGLEKQQSAGVGTKAEAEGLNGVSEGAGGIGEGAEEAEELVQQESGGESSLMGRGREDSNYIISLPAKNKVNGDVTESSSKGKGQKSAEAAPAPRQTAAEGDKPVAATLIGGKALREGTGGLAGPGALEGNADGDDSLVITSSASEDRMVTSHPEADDGTVISSVDAENIIVLSSHDAVENFVISSAGAEDSLVPSDPDAGVGKQSIGVDLDQEILEEDDEGYAKLQNIISAAEKSIKEFQNDIQVSSGERGRKGKSVWLKPNGLFESGFWNDWPSRGGNTSALYEVKPSRNVWLPQRKKSTRSKLKFKKRKKKL